MASVKNNKSKNNGTRVKTVLTDLNSQLQAYLHALKGVSVKTQR